MYNKRRITKYLTLEKAKRLVNVVIDRQFNYAPLSWMYCQNTLYLKIEKIHYKTLRIIHQSNVSCRVLLELFTSQTSHIVFCWNYSPVKRLVSCSTRMQWQYFYSPTIFAVLIDGNLQQYCNCQPQIRVALFQRKDSSI